MKLSPIPLIFDLDCAIFVDLALSLLYSVLNWVVFGKLIAKHTDNLELGVIN